MGLLNIGLSQVGVEPISIAVFDFHIVPIHSTLSSRISRCIIVLKIRTYWSVLLRSMRSSDMAIRRAHLSTMKCSVVIISLLITFGAGNLHLIIS